MAAYIDRDATVESLDAMKPFLRDRGQVQLLRRIMNHIDKIPVADVVHVVRCKDCKHSGMYCFGRSEKERLACLDVEEDGFVRFATAVDAEHFCSYGERKEADGNG